MSGIAWIGEDETGTFRAHVAYEHDGPFDVMHGPDGVSAAEAIAWARGYVPRVAIRTVDGGEFTAGVEAVDGLPVWTQPVESPGDLEAVASPEVPWRVYASMWWANDDRQAVGAEIARHVAADRRASATTVEIAGERLTVAFVVRGASMLEAHEIASRILRTAWPATGIVAEPGKDYDTPDIGIGPATG